MSHLSPQEAVASLHVLVAVAQADGKLERRERDALAAAIREVGLDGVMDAQDLFDDRFDLAPQLVLLQSPTAREETFRSAFSLAYADGECSDGERELLAKLRADLAVPSEVEEEMRQLVDHLLAERAASRPGHVERIDDADERSRAIRSATLKCAIVSATFGAFPFPGLSILTDLAALYLQIELVRDIGAMHGRTIDKKHARSLLAVVGVGTTARLAVSNLAKLFPGWGSIVGATTSFASAYGLGAAFDKHFEAELDHEGLVQVFQQARAEGEREYHANTAEIEATSQRAQTQLAALAERRRAGTLSGEELHEHISKI